MILTPTKCSDTAITYQAAERLPVLDCSQIPCQFFAGMNVPLERLVIRQLVVLGQHQERHDHQRAGAAHAGGHGQIAGKGHRHPLQSTVEIHRDPPSDGHRIVPPAPYLRNQLGTQREHHFLIVLGINNAYQVVQPADGHCTESAFHRGDQAAAARVVRVLSQHFDAPRNKTGGGSV